MMRVENFLRRLSFPAEANAHHDPAAIGYFPDKVISSNLVQ
jgi:hypothetical protein